MKKKLEAELVSIAHRILQMKNKSDLVQLHQETQKLYEKLSVLRFVDEHFAQVKPTIGQAEAEAELSAIFDNDISANVEPTETAEPIELPVDKKKVAKAVVEPTEPAAEAEAINDIISGISENASKQEPAAEQEEVKLEEEAEAAFATAEEIEPVAELESPEEQVAPVEAAATAEAEEAEEEQESEKIEEAAEQAQAETVAEESAKADELFKPAFEWGFDAKKEEVKIDEPIEAKITPAQISFDDLLGQDYVDPVFVKPEEVDTPMPTANTPIVTTDAPIATTSSDDDRRAAELAESNKRLADLREAANKPLSERQNVIPISRNFVDTSNVISINKENLNDRISKGITIGLNDRIAFMKHLFDNSSEDYNRVLSQLITFDTLSEAKDFIDNVVKPDYNNWDGKDEYEQRFMEIVEKKFA